LPKEGGMIEYYTVEYRDNGKPSFVCFGPARYQVFFIRNQYMATVRGNFCKGNTIDEFEKKLDRTMLIMSDGKYQRE